MKVVYSNFTLGAIEENITNLIKECKIWSDLNMSYDEYDILNQKICEMMGGGPDVLQIQKRYPLVNITHAIHVIIYEEYEEFWDFYSKKLGITLSNSEKTVLKKNWSLIIEKVGLKKHNYEIGQAESMPLLYQAGIPNRELDDIFDTIKYSRDTHKDFQPQMLMDQLTSWRSYAAGPSTKAYIEIFADKAQEFFSQVNDLIKAEAPQTENYSERLLNKYDGWREKQKYLGRKHPRTSELSSPYLMYDKEKSEFSLFLPPCSVTNDYISYMTYIIADNDHNRYEGKVKVMTDTQGRYIKQQVVPVKAARAYVIHWYDDIDKTNPILDKKITGALGYGSVIFDYDGKRIQEVFCQESVIEENNHLNPDFQEPVLDNIRYKESFGEENRPILYWDALNSYPVSSFSLRQLDDFMPEVKIHMTKCRKLKSVSGEKHFVYLGNKLQTGIYKIFQEEKCNLPEDTYVPLKIGKMHIFKHKEEGYKDRIGSLNDILVTTLMNYDSIKVLEKIKTVVKETGKKRDSYLDKRGCRILTLLICNFCKDCSSEDEELLWQDNHKNCNNTIEEILKLISIHMLNGQIRGFIVQNLSKYDLSEKQFSKCFHVLDLQTAVFGLSKEITGGQIDKLAEENHMTAMRLLMKDKMSFKNGMRLLRLAGIDAMQEMLHFRKKPDTMAEWLECYEELINGNLVKTDYRFLPTYKVMGNHKEFNDLVEWGASRKSSSPEMNFSGKQSDGIKFCGRIYLDVLIAWYMKYINKTEETMEAAKELISQISSIEKMYLSLKPEIRNSIIFYERALKERYIEEKSIFATFYYCGLVSVILATHPYLELDEETFSTCDGFLQKMYQIFPELVERDLLLADAYVLFNIGLA